VLGASVDSLAFPSVGRVIFGFLVTVGLSVAVAFLLRRGGWPVLLRRRSLNSAIRSVDRATVSATLTVHLIELDGVRVMIAESRSGVGMTVLPAGSNRSPE
jgi:hypothetical protein